MKIEEFRDFSIGDYHRLFKEKKLSPLELVNLFLERIKAKIKEKIKVVLEKAGFYNRGQFWGWMRDRKEYNKLMEKAGYIDINDGFIETDSQRTYFIEGHNR